MCNERVFFVTACSVMIVGNHSAGKSSFINWYIGERVVKTGVAIETRGFILCTSGRSVWLAYRAPARGIGALVQNSTQCPSCSRVQINSMCSYVSQRCVW